MRRRWRIRSFGGTAVTAIVVGLWLGSRPSVPDLEAADRVTLFSIDGPHVFNERGPVAGEEVHGYPVLGKVAIADPVERRALAQALRDGLSGDDEMAKCFIPRHALRVERDGRAVEYVICFHCRNYDLYVNGQRASTGSRSFNRQVRPTFDAPLTAAGVPIAPE